MNRSRFWLLLTFGQVDIKGRSDANRRFDGQESFGLLHDPVANRQAQPGSATQLFRREERIEDAVYDFLGNAGAAVADAESNVRTDSGIRLPRCLVAVHELAAHLNQ